MPAFRNVPTRRSKRLSLHEPRSYHGDDQDWEKLDLTYPPSPGPQSNATSTSISSAVSSLSLSSSSDDLSSEPFVPSASHARRRKPGHIPRPPNAFMIFRSDLWRKRKLDPDVERDHRNISVIAGILWRELSAEEQKRFQLRAIQEKQRHALANPGYKYSPVVRKEKSGKKKTRNDDREDQNKCKELASLWMKDLEEIHQDNKPANVKCELPSPQLSAVSTPRPSSPTPVLMPQSPTVPGTVSPSALKEESRPSFATEWVPIAEIPLLELNCTTDDVDDVKPQQRVTLDLQPPRFSPSYVQPHFGVKPEAKEFSDNFLLSHHLADEESEHEKPVILAEPSVTPFAPDTPDDFSTAMYPEFSSWVTIY